MTKIREPLSVEFILGQILNKFSEDEIKLITGKSISHFRKCSDPDDKDHNLHFLDGIKLDVLLQKKQLGTPFLDNYTLIVENELKNIDEYGNLSSNLLNIGERIGNLMGVANQAIDPTGPSGSKISKKEKDDIHKAIADVEQKIAKLKLSVK